MSWPFVRFESVYAEPSRNGIYKSAEHHGVGAKIVNMGELFAHEFVGPQQMSRLAMNEAELEKAGLCDGDLLFGRRSLVESGAGKCSLVEGISEPTTFESSIIRVRPEQGKVVPRFYYYWFRSLFGRGSIRAIVSGTNVKGIRGSDLKNVLVPLPDFDEQQRIADRLSTYDNLIENNRRRIALLEQSARLLYREWFVHLRFPGHEHVKMLEGVPERWERVPFSAFANFINGYPFKPDELFEAGLPIIKIPELRDGITDKTPRNTGDNIPEKYAVVDKDLLFSWSGTLMVNFWHQGPAILNQHLFRVDPLGRCSREFLYFAINEGMPAFTNQTTGATMKHIRKSALDTVKALVAPKELMLEFQESVGSSFDLIHNLHQQNTKLRQARDLLLPRLMSEDIQRPTPQ